MSQQKPTAEEIAAAVAAIAAQPPSLLAAVGLDPANISVASASDIWGHRLGHVAVVHVDFSDDALLAPGLVETTWHVRLRRGVVHSVEHTRTVMREDGTTFDSLPPLDPNEE